MRHDRFRSSTAWRRLLGTLVAALGVIAIIGSGGGGVGFPDLDFGGPFTFTPTTSVEPARTIVQVGGSATFTANPIFATAPLSYQWRRNGVDLAGATAQTYTLVGANLADDGARYEVTVTASNGVASAAGILLVSSAPAVVLRDSDFPFAGWTVSAVAVPASNGPTHAVTQALTGGDPDAFRSISYQATAGPSSLRLFHTAVAAAYDPALQGAVYVVDLALSCNRLATSTSSETYAWPAFEQGGRWFVPQRFDAFCVPFWMDERVSSLHADEFAILAGPACGAAQACPDFSAGAAPLRFGFVSGVNLTTGVVAGTIAQGIDNWIIKVWRR